MATMGGYIGGEMQARLAHGRYVGFPLHVFIGGSGEHDRFPFLLRKRILAHGRDVFLGIDLIYDLIIL